MVGLDADIVYLLQLTVAIRFKMWYNTNIAEARGDKILLKT